MWQPGFQPQFGFEQAAQVLGLNRARELWEGYKVMEARKAQEADAIEQAMAHDRRNKQYLVNEELEGAPEWRMAPWSFVRLHRASLNEKGAVGGEFFDDSHYMRWFLKKNPALRIHAGSGKIMEGWTPASDQCPYARLQKAAAQAMTEEVQGVLRVEQAAAAGAYEREMAAERRGGIAIAS